MKFSHIVPVKLITKYSGDFVMCLSNYLADKEVNEYEKQVVAAKLPIVLDNGAFETGHPDGIDNLIRKAKRINPAYIFAPDTLFNAKQTRAGFEEFEYIKKNQEVDFKTAVVVQADNLEEYLEQFIFYNEDPRVTVIGLSYLAISYAMKYPQKKDIPKTKATIKSHPFDVFKDPDYTADRIEMLKKIIALKLPKLKPLHLLGLGKSYDDIVFAINNLPEARYNDTSTCYMASKNKIAIPSLLNIPGGKIREKINIEDDPGPLTINLLQNNINKIKTKLCK